MLQLLWFVKNNQDQHLEKDLNSRNSKTVPDLTKNIHLGRDDKGALKINQNLIKNEKKENLKMIK